MSQEVSSVQIRGARAMLGWSQDQLAARAGITRKTLAGLEAGDRDNYRSTLAKVVAALEEAGARFIATETGSGVIVEHRPPT